MKKGRSPETGSGSEGRGKGSRRKVGLTSEAPFKPFSRHEFLMQYHKDHIGAYGSTAAVQKEFEVDRWAAHLLVASLPPNAPEGSITGAQHFDATLARLEKSGHKKEEALVRTFIITADAIHVPEETVQMWYVTRDYDFTANGIEHPGDWIKHDRI